MLIRIDDIGTSAKEFEQHGQKWFKIFGKKALYFPFANFWFFKRTYPFKRWGKYKELTVEEWGKFLEVFEKNKIVPVVAITACWVDENSNLIPFPEKFKEEAKFLKNAFHEGKIIIANHGLTHCEVGNHLPKFWGSNRRFWREFTDSLSEFEHKLKIIKSQEILENFFEKQIEIFVPPGNVWSVKTYRSLFGTSIKTVMTANPPSSGQITKDGPSIIYDKDNVFAFHDRELKLFGQAWLEDKINLWKNL